jgi:hypothetical protein
MTTETNVDGFEWEYADNRTYRQVVDYLNSGEIHKIEGEILRSKAGDILEKVEENYLEPDEIRETGAMYPTANHFDDDNSTGRTGRALSALASDESPTEFSTWWGTGTKDTYDMSNVDLKNFCGVLEVSAKVEDEVLNMETHPDRDDKEHQDAFMERLDI